MQIRSFIINILQMVVSRGIIRLLRERPKRKSLTFIKAPQLAAGEWKIRGCSLQSALCVQQSHLAKDLMPTFQGNAYMQRHIITKRNILLFILPSIVNYSWRYCFSCVCRAKSKHLRCIVCHSTV